ncbi:MAG: hypothetical protein HQ522_10160, partial [Bacteroidetes bacterium]|nr:hypothetical protein [Bacteroidota bacterium]
TLDFDNRPLYFYKNSEQAVRMGPWKAYRKSPRNNIELYLIEDDVHSDRNLAENYPEVVQKIDSIMKAAHELHQWYRDPWESENDYQIKIDKAKRTKNLQIATRPNGL